jgi:hypothetical protein
MDETRRGFLKVAATAVGAAAAPDVVQAQGPGQVSLFWGYPLIERLF